MCVCVFVGIACVNIKWIYFMYRFRYIDIIHRFIIFNFVDILGYVDHNGVTARLDGYTTVAVAKGVCSTTE